MQMAIGASPKIKDPNILLITVDTLRADHVGVYSDLNVKTPHMDALAARSSVFRWAFAHNPVTLPSHVNIMTGTSPLYHGISDNTGFKLEDRFLTMAEWLKEQNYATGAFISAFPLDAMFGLAQGFDFYEDDLGVQQVYKSTFVERPASDVIAMAINWIEGQENKWFSFIHLFDAHEPYAPPAPYDKMYADVPYSGEVAFIDSQLGILFDYLESKKMMDNTIIILTADHGEAFGEKGEWVHGYFAYNITIHIPLIIYVPGGKSGWVEENAAHIDLFQTVCDLLGKKSPDHLQGESLVPFMNGTARRTTPIYFESMTPHFVTGLAPLSGFIQGSDKFIDLPIPEFYSFYDDWTENDNLANKKNIKDLSTSLQRLREKLTYHESGVRSDVDAKTLAKLKTLGYVSGGSRPEKKAYTKNDDPKTLAPVENIIHLAKLKHLNGQRSAAAADLENVIKKWPRFLSAYILLSRIYYTEKQYDKAETVLKKGLAASRRETQLREILGAVYIGAGRFGDAVGVLQKAVGELPENPETRNLLGVALQQTGKPDEALLHYQKALELTPNFGYALNNIGSLYMLRFKETQAKKDVQQALDYFEKAIHLDPHMEAAKIGRDAALRILTRLEKK